MSIFGPSLLSSPSSLLSTHHGEVLRWIHPASVPKPRIPGYFCLRHQGPLGPGHGSVKGTKRQSLRDRPGTGALVQSEEWKGFTFFELNLKLGGNRMGDRVDAMEDLL